MKNVTRQLTKESSLYMWLQARKERRLDAQDLERMAFYRQFLRPGAVFRHWR